MFRRTRLFALVALLGLILTGMAVGSSNSTYDFLRADANARAAALAGSFVSILGDPNSIFFNPAGLATIQTPAGSVGFFKHLLDINAGFVSYTYPLEDVGNLSAGIVYFNYGSFEETDDLGNSLGTFSANDLAFSAGYSNILSENLYYGVSGKLIYSQIAGYSSTGLGLDAGIVYNIPDSKVTVGGSIRNMGVQLSKFGTTREDLPLDIVIGGTVIPKGLPLLFCLNFHKLNESADNLSDRLSAFSVGGEFTLSPVLQLRFGYDNAQRRDLKIGTSSGLAGMSGGIGLTIKDYKVDYSLNSLGKVGSLHRISIATSF